MFEAFGNTILRLFLARGRVGIAFAIVLPVAAPASELELPPGQTSFEFGGGPRSISVEFRNPSSNAIAAAKLRYRLYQSSSGASVPLGPVTEWKTLSVGAGQRLTDQVTCSLPAVRAGSTFHLVWLDDDRKLGATLVQVFPKELLQPLASMTPIGLVDPSGAFTNTLAAVGFQLLAEAEEISAFDGKLIVVAPMSGPNVIAGLGKALKRRATAGTGVVWIQSVRPAGLNAISSSYVVDHGEGHLVIAQESLVAELSSSPLSQLHLLTLAELALGQKKLGLPDDSRP